MEDRRKEFREKNLLEWEEIINGIFNFSVPSYCTWESHLDIIKIFNKIGSKPNSNHTFMPSGGGLDLSGANISHEENCIELKYGGLVDIVKPKKLIFNYLGDNFEWAYFRLETEELEPSGIYEELPEKFISEELTEISPLHYEDRSIWEHGYYNGEPLPKSARAVSRFFKGTFLIVAKSSIYNQIPATYDGRHNKFNDKQYKEYMLAIKEKTTK